MNKLLISLLSISLLVSCSSSSIDNAPSTSSSGVSTNSSTGPSQKPYDPFQYDPFELETIDLVISTFEEIKFDDMDIVDLKVESFQILEYEYIKDLNQKDLFNESDVKIEEIKKNLAEGTSIYLVAFTVRSARLGPQTALAAFATDVALGLVVDFVIDVLPKLFSSESKESTFKLVDAFLFLSRGYKLGSYFDLSFSLVGLAFTSTFGRVIQKRTLTKTIAKNLDSTAKVVNEAVDVVSKQSENIFKGLDNVTGQDIKRLDDILYSNIDNLDASQEVKRVIKDAIKRNPNELKSLLSGLDKNILDNFQKYLDTDNYKKLISGIRTSILPEAHPLRNSSGSQIKALILERTNSNIKYFNDNGISHERLLEYLRNAYPNKLEIPSSVSRTYNFYLEDLKNIPLGNTTYKNAIKNESLVRGLSIENIQRLNSIKMYDNAISESQSLIIEKYYNAVLTRKNYITGTTVLQIADGIEKLVKNGDTAVLGLIPTNILKKELLDSVSDRISYTFYKKTSEDIMVDYLVKNIKDETSSISESIARKLANAPDKLKLESVIRQIDSPKLQEKAFSEFGFKEISKDEFITTISRNVNNESIAKVFADNYPDKTATRNALNSMLSDPNSNKLQVEYASKRIDELYKYNNPKINGELLYLLVQPKLISQYSNLAFQLDHIRAIKLLNNVFNPTDVARFENLMKSSSDGLIKGGFSDEKMQRIALQYMREVQTRNLDQLTIKNLNIITFSKFSRQTDPNLILRESEKLYEIFSVPRTVEEIDGIISSLEVNLRNSLTDIYQNNILRQSELILELNNKKLISLNQDFIVKVVKDDLLRISKNASSEQIRSAAAKIIENDVMEKIVSGEFSSLSNDVAESVLYKYDSILPFVKTLPDTAQNSFFDTIARIRGKKSVDRLLAEKQKFLSKLTTEGISPSTRIEYENAIKRIDEHLKRDFLPARDNQSFLQFASNYGLNYDQAIERFYTVIEFELDGQIIRKHYARLDAFADLAVTSVELTGDNAVDFLLVRRMINMQDDPFTLTQHHLEDGLNILFVSTDVHKALYHEGGASLLRLLEDLKQIESLV
jgi:hypothetical protein